MNFNNLLKKISNEYDAINVIRKLASENYSYKTIDKFCHLAKEKDINIELYTKSYQHLFGSQLCKCGRCIGYHTWETVEWIVSLNGGEDEEVIFEDETDYERVANLPEEEFLCDDCAAKLKEGE